MRRPSFPHRLKLFHLWIPISVLTVIASRLVSETGSIYSLIFPVVKSPQCMMREITGLSCGTCGMTGAFSAISKGDLISASLKHPLSVPLFFSLIGLGVVASLDLLGFQTISFALFRYWEKNRKAITITIISLLMIAFFARFIGEIQSGYLKPDGLKKMMFFWYYVITWNPGTTSGQ